MNGEISSETVLFMDTLESEKLTRDGELMYSVGNQNPIAHCYLVVNSGENTEVPLHCTANDLQYVATTFTTIGAKVEFQQRYKGMEGQDVENLLNTLKAMDLKSCPCFIFYYSGHGKDCSIQLGENRTFSFRTIVDTITSLPDLQKKPKVFIFDCCRVYSGQPEPLNNCKGEAESYTDCIIAYACSSGEQAFISNSPYMKNNSIFTKAFCTMLMANHHQWSLVSILIHASSITNKSMKDYYHQTRLMSGNNQEQQLTSQTPHVIVKLRKQLYLCCKFYRTIACIMYVCMCVCTSDVLCVYICLIKPWYTTTIHTYCTAIGKLPSNTRHVNTWLFF